MLIETEILIAWGAVSKKYKKNEIIFLEEDVPRFYYQVLTGRVKMFNNCDTKEFIQGIFVDGESFGEPPLFNNEMYAATAIALANTVVIRISRERFRKLLVEYPKLQTKFLELFATRLYEKSLAAKELVNNSPEVRIKSFLDNYKKKAGKNNGKLLIDLTRQEIANFTGLCVETVIRTLSKMKSQNKVSIIDKKLYY
ncbi:MAG: Crp/Fnr family transcriptional regulator [Sphingobacteriales bacterium]|jgi:CRP-like cAMP-binding protein|nr:Crp/Fnr family transcriptional regulator [Sphingobacteriales bacterium]